VNLLGRCVMDDVTPLDALVLALQPRIDPERAGADDLFLVVTHGSGNVHDVNDQCIGLGLRRGAPGAVAAVILNWNDSWSQWFVAAIDQLPSQGGDIGATKMAQRLRARAANARVFRFLLL